jgi:heavy metal translocating P-type ATPase
MRHANSWIATLAVVCIVLHFVFPMVGLEAQREWPLFVALVGGGGPLVWDLLKQTFAREFGADFLAGISIVTALILGEYLAGSVIVLMLSGGEALEDYAVGRASDVLRALADRMPTLAHRKEDGELVDIAVEDIEIGDEIVVMPHELCPVDGEVVEGRGSMDESYLTGEPVVVSKAPGSNVLSGAINSDSAITIRATRRAVDSRYASIMKVMEHAQQTKPKMRRLADKLGAWYTPLAVSVALAAWALSGNPTRFLAVIVVATPCPLLIAIPVSMIGSISLAAKHAIVIRDASIMERLDTCKTLIFDKTGTLTLGKPALTNIEAGDGAGDGAGADDVLAMAASVERYSKHPLATAIVAAAEERDLPKHEVEDISEKPGQGLTARVAGRTLRITSRNKLADAGHAAHDDLPEMVAGLECVILVDDAYAATFQFRDEPRSEGRPFIAHLGPKHGFEKVMLVSGDRESEVRYLAESVGVDTIHAECSPEEKVEIVKREEAAARTIFIGDGINDAPALMTANVGIAFGGTHEITTEAAGAVILEPSLTKVDELFHIARRNRRIALQSAFLGMGLSMFGMGFAAFGFLSPVAGAVAQEFIDLAAVLNALRTSIRPKDELTDF